jgi:hypothetical protein
MNRATPTPRIPLSVSDELNRISDEIGGLGNLLCQCDYLESPAIVSLSSLLRGWSKVLSQITMIDREAQ